MKTFEYNDVIDNAHAELMIHHALGLISEAKSEYLAEKRSIQTKLAILANELGKRGRPCDCFECPYAKRRDGTCSEKLTPMQCWIVFAHIREKEFSPGILRSQLEP